MIAKQIRAITECRASGIRCRSDAEKLYVDFEVMCSACVMAHEEADCVQVIRMLSDKAKDPEKGAVATLYFPENGESMFDIAKKYKISRVSLMERNGITSEEEIKGKALLIPKKR